MNALPHSSGAYRLFGSPGSGSAAIEVALDWAGLPFELVRAATWEPDSALEALTQVNPLRQIPTLCLPDGTVISESVAILIFLGTQHPNSDLLPTASAPLARALRGLVYIAANCYSAVSISDFPERWCQPSSQATAARVRQGARAQLHQHWTLFADLFPDQPFLLGEAPGALDVLAAVVSKWSGTRQHLAQARPAFLATLQRIEQHPRVRPVFERHWPPSD